MEFHLLGGFPGASGCGVGWSSLGLGFFPQNRRLFPSHPGGLAGRFPLGRGLGKSRKRGLETPGKGDWKPRLGSLNPAVLPGEKELWSRDHFPNNPDLGLELGLDPWLSPLSPGFPSWRTTGSNPFSLSPSRMELFPKKRNPWSFQACWKCWNSGG